MATLGDSSSSEDSESPSDDGVCRLSGAIDFWGERDGIGLEDTLSSSSLLFSESDEEDTSLFCVLDSTGFESSSSDESSEDDSCSELDPSD
jgi:hypothetical protein